MMDKLENLLAALRDELQQYGEMLARLDSHQDLLLQRQPDHLLHSAAEIEAQGVVLHEARRRRERCREQLTNALGLSASSTFQELALRLPDDYRPLLAALVEENNELLVRVQQRSRQNHLLLTRTIDIMQRFIGSLFPGNTSPVYNGNGLVLGPAPGHASLYDAVG